MNWRQGILSAIARPEVLFLLLLGALAGLGAEISHPGTLFPGILGAVCLILFLFASQIIPVNGAGVLLILLAVASSPPEVKVALLRALDRGRHHRHDPRGDDAGGRAHRRDARAPGRRWSRRPSVMALGRPRSCGWSCRPSGAAPRHRGSGHGRPARRGRDRPRPRGLGASWRVSAGGRWRKRPWPPASGARRGGGGTPLASPEGDVMPDFASSSGSSCFWLLLSVKVLNEYERGVVFRLGKLLPRPRDPASSSLRCPSTAWCGSACARWSSTSRPRT